MTLTFDVFTKKTKLYYITRAISIITFISIATAAIFNVQGKSAFEPFIDAIIIICTFIMLGFFMTAGLGFVRTYIKEGELVLSDDYLVIDGIKIPMDGTKGLGLNLGLRTRRRGWYIVSNRIEVMDKEGKIHKNRFAIKSYDDNAVFEKLLDLWRANNVAFNLRYHSVW